MDKLKEFKNRLGEDGLSQGDFGYNLEYYGEMVPTVFAWITPEEQKRRAEEMGDMLNKRDGKAKDVDLGFKNMGLQ